MSESTPPDPTCRFLAGSRISQLLTQTSPAARRATCLLSGSLLFLGLISLMVATLSVGGFDALDLLLTALFAMTLPWTIIGMLNALIGLAVMRLVPAPERAVCPVDYPPADTPIEVSTAIAVCIRNEDVATVTRNLEHMLAGLRRDKIAHAFHVYILSDSDDPKTVLEEERRFAELAMRWRTVAPIDYRRRSDNRGFKAGNIREFLLRWGHRHELMLVLDADSFMTAEAIARLVRIMQANPRIGILQSLINGMPPRSAFSRVFQFGMRLGMRSYTIGSAWWQADCGPYWGHNAVIRVAPFIEHCQLAPIPGNGPLRGAILSHDQVEAVLMRRAGFEVRVLPVAEGSFEENPQSLVEFVRRDLRWCLGNMQYLHLLGTAKLHTLSRLQLLLAVLMFAGSPAWLCFITVGALRVGFAEHPSATFDQQLGIWLFLSVMTMVFAPKLATVLDLLIDRTQRRVFGGPVRIIASLLGDVLFFSMLSPIMAIAHSWFIAGLPFGRKTGWSAQRRGTHRIGLLEGWRRFWPQTLFGAAALGWIAVLSDVPLWSVLPFALGPLLAVPFAVCTASERAGFAFARLGLWRVPEETSPPADLAALLLAEGGRRAQRLQTTWAEAAADLQIEQAATVDEPLTLPALAAAPAE